MTYITESELREMWRNGSGQLPIFSQKTRFSAAALDFLKAHQLNVCYTTDELPVTEKSKDDISNNNSSWDKPGQYPVVLSGAVPVCQECGTPLFSKPEHMTQIDAGHFAAKTSPRLIFRGRIDSLHAIVMLTASISRKFELPELAKNLDTLAAYCREIMSAEYNFRPVAALVMMGKNENELHEISHWPEKQVGIPHLVPCPRDHEVIHWLNFLRSQSREVEIVALQAFPTTELDTTSVGFSLAHALNRLSSAIYVLELYFQAGILNWKVKG